MQPTATRNEFLSPEFLFAREQEHESLRSEIRGLERIIEHIYDRGEQYPGEISLCLSDLDELRTREWFAGGLVSIMQTGKMPPGRRYPDHAGQITDLMIERARAYPIDKLVNVGRSRKIRCLSPDHEDRNPSMRVYENSCYCFSCHFSADTIKVYQILHSCTFPEAVRALNV